MLGPILCVTSTTQDLDRALAAYQSALGYRLVDSGRVSPDQATSWQAPKAAGRRFGILAPGDGEIVHLRLIENPQAPYIPAHATFGWNVSEFNVGAVADLAKDLAGGPFRHVAGPAPLSMNTDITAMQALGPDGELVYFTQIDPTEKTKHLPHRDKGVGRVFIMVLGVRDYQAARREFDQHFGSEMTDPIPFSSPRLSGPLNLPDDHIFQLGLVRLPGKFSLEIDELGDFAKTRPVNDGDLPPGISIVSFSIKSFDQVAATFGQNAYQAGAPFGTQRAILVRGPGDALFELVEQTY
jgi:catechol 2,3-dioxygenase-like lactoylglutathione lyase family enzyme